MGAEPAAAARLRREDEQSRAAQIDQLQRKLSPEGALLDLAEQGAVTVEQLNETQRTIEAKQIKLQAELLRTADPEKKADLQKEIEANSRLIFKIEDARHDIENAGATDKPEEASRILLETIGREREVSTGADEAILAISQEQSRLDEELQNLYLEIAARESGSRPSPGLGKKISFGLGNLLRRISNQPEQAKPIEGMSLKELIAKRSATQQRLNELQVSLNNMRLQAATEAAWTPPSRVKEKPIELGEEDIISEEAAPIELGDEDIISAEEIAPPTVKMRRAPRPLTAEEKAAQPELMRQQSDKAMKLVEAKLRKLEDQRAALDKELAETEKKIANVREMTKGMSLPSTRQSLRKLEQKRDQINSDIDGLSAKALELMRQMPAPLPKAPEVLGKEDIIEEEEIPVELDESDIIAEEVQPTPRRPRAPRPVSAEALASQPNYAEDQARKTIKLIEAGLQKLEARKAKAESELAKLKKNGPSAKREALEAELDKIAEEARKLMARYPKETPPTVLTEADFLPEEEAVEEIKDEDIIESEEISGVRRKPRATPPPLPEAARRTKEQAAEEKEKAEFQKRVSWAEKLLPGGQASAMNQDVLGQMGVDWASANEQQRNFSVEYVFKAAAVQEALNAGDDKSYNRELQSLKNFEKTLGLVRSPYLQPAGKAGVGVTLETGRAEQGRAATRIAGGQETARGRARARRFENEAAPIEAVTTEYAEAQAAEEARRKAEQEEKTAAGARAAEAALAKANIVPEIPEHLKQEAEIGKRMMVPMSIERTAAAVPKAKELWDLVAQTIDKLDKELEASGAKHRKSVDVVAAANEPNMKDAATAYVMAMGRYLEAVNEPAPDYVIRAFGKRIEKMNKALGLAGNALVQSIMAERGRTFGKPVGRNFNRDKVTTAQQARRAARF